MCGPPFDGRRLITWADLPRSDPGDVVIGVPARGTLVRARRRYVGTHPAVEFVEHPRAYRCRRQREVVHAALDAHDGDVPAEPAGVPGDVPHVEYRVGTSWRLSGAYIGEDAKVTDGGVANAALVGKYLQQVPKNRGSIQIAYSSAKYANVALGVQFVGLQYNDDLNVNFIPTATLADAGYDAVAAGLPGYTVVDFTASRDIGRNLQVFFGAQNLFDQVYFVQTNPSTIGTPRLVNVGVRIRLSGR